MLLGVDSEDLWDAETVWNEESWYGFDNETWYDHGAGLYTILTLDILCASVMLFFVLYGQEVGASTMLMATISNMMMFLVALTKMLAITCYNCTGFKTKSKL